MSLIVVVCDDDEVFVSVTSEIRISGRGMCANPFPLPYTEIRSGTTVNNVPDGSCWVEAALRALATTGSIGLMVIGMI